MVKIKIKENENVEKSPKSLFKMLPIKDILCKRDFISIMVTPITICSLIVVLCKQVLQKPTLTGNWGVDHQKACKFNSVKNVVPYNWEINMLFQNKIIVQLIQVRLHLYMLQAKIKFRLKFFNSQEIKEIVNQPRIKQINVNIILPCNIYYIVL